jgi:hypothetical protein
MSYFMETRLLSMADELFRISSNLFVFAEKGGCRKLLLVRRRAERLLRIDPRRTAISIQKLIGNSKSIFSAIDSACDTRLALPCRRGAAIRAGADIAMIASRFTMAVAPARRPTRKCFRATA